MGFFEVLSIVVISALTAAVSEVLSYWLVFSTTTYQSTAAQIDRQQKKLEKMKESGDESDKRVAREEQVLSELQRDMSLVKMRTFFAVGLPMMVVFGWLNSAYDRVVVCRLPFEPLSLVRGITHRNIAGDDFYECGFTFIYVLCSMSVRPLVQKVLGLTPKQDVSANPMASFFPTAASADDEKKKKRR